MKNTRLIIVLAAILAFSSGLAAMAEENNKVEFAIVNFTEITSEVLEVDGEIEMLSQAEVGEKAGKMGYDLVIDATSIELYMDGIIENITCLNNEVVTEEVTPIIDEKENLEEIKDLEEVVVITEKVIEELQN